ncbi:NADH:flavin oxidoreductase [Sphingopyxis sp. FBM22]|uniref:NADH:flavin oxidoreductase n=1 Tax=Sphingopyxis yananensis TaxID=2886687 RepID=UPI001D11344D|nr:NADH:flavin oxidoreductase [Sphingopyxis yananensis]MCC2603128.1 NADH:flavin oxidoreductase [Sphingopyxis yananensis]
MSSADLFQPLEFHHGKAMNNRLMLAPLTNQQSHADGLLSDEEHHWLAMRAAGGYGLVMTAAAHVQANGQGFPGQLGIFGDQHLPALTRLADDLRQKGALSAVQLHHAGYRAPANLVNDIVSPSGDADSGARALSLDEVYQLRDDFIAAALRAEQAGFDGVEVHGAHGYILSAFLSPELNRRDDEYGGTAENRARLLLEILDGIRQSCDPDFQLGVRLSPERFGQNLAEVVALTQSICATERVDYVDMSLWDVRKRPIDAAEDDSRLLLHHFTEIPRGKVRLGAAGKIMNGQTARWLLDQGCDFALLGRAAIIEHDFPQKLQNNVDHAAPALPVTSGHLTAQGVSPKFQSYLSGWPNFIQD